MGFLSSRMSIDLKTSDIISKLITINFMINKNKYCADEAQLATLWKRGETR